MSHFAPYPSARGSTTQDPLYTECTREQLTAPKRATSPSATWCSPLPPQDEQRRERLVVLFGLGMSTSFTALPPVRTPPWSPPDALMGPIKRVPYGSAA
jgi:hypothetical protein